MGARGSSGPRVRVAALMLLNGKVVTVRHRAGSAVYHLLPGGGVNYRETIADALTREIREETGLEASLGEPLFISDTIDPSGSRHLVNITFMAEVTGGQITDAPQDDRVEGVELIDPMCLSELDLRPPMADALSDFLNSAVGDTPRYLGPLFTEGTR